MKSIGTGILAAGVMLVAGCEGMGLPHQGGDAAGVGIVGTVTGNPGGTGVSVNGIDVATTPSTVLNGPIEPLGALEAGIIPPGHVVEIAAERTDAGLVARELEPIHALSGPVTSTAGGRLYVMGAEVVPEDGAVLPAGGIGAFRPGQRVAVSGLWQGDRVIASRIDFQARKSTQQATVAGVVTPTPGARYAIGPVPVAAEFGTLRPGYFHAVRGEWVTGTLVAEDIRIGRTVVGNWPTDVLSVEGYGRTRDFAGYYSGYPGPDRGGYTDGYTRTNMIGKLGKMFGEGEPAWRDRYDDLDGLGRPVGRSDQVGNFADTRAVFVGPYSGGADGRFHVDYVIPIPEGAGARAATLAEVGDGLDPVTGAVAE